MYQVVCPAPLEYDFQSKQFFSDSTITSLCCKPIFLISFLLLDALLALWKIKKSSIRIACVLRCDPMHRHSRCHSERSSCQRWAHSQSGCDCHDLGALVRSGNLFSGGQGLRRSKQASTSCFNMGGFHRLRSPDLLHVAVQRY